MDLEFEKWHGNKNDFILTWFPHDELAFASLRRQAPSLCTRDGSGIGADGILVLHTTSSNDLLPFQLSIINSDGSLADTCGNGIRCAALSILKKHHNAKPKVELPHGLEFALRSSRASVQFMGILEERANGLLPLVAVDMGKAVVNVANDDYEKTAEFIQRVATDLNMPELVQGWTLVSLGNRHLVFSMDKVSRELIRKIGPKFQTSELWDGINVHITRSKFVSDGDRRTAKMELGQSMDELYETYVWERGAGETQACGSGACAVAVSQWMSGLSDRSNWIGVDMPGGRLYIKQASAEDTITMAGPAKMSFRGRVQI
jgi:diaminopimelate epimerase